jgi:hypothetical protein
MVTKSDSIALSGFPLQITAKVRFFPVSTKFKEMYKLGAKHIVF